MPDDWKEDPSFLLEWSQDALINLLALCVSRGIDGVMDKIDNHGKASDKLSVLESALDFSLSDWWQPDSDNFFSRISKASISDCLKNAGHETEAKQALTLKKSDAAQFAAQTVNNTGWLPDCLMTLSTPE
ncbi:hypothetical protein AAH678_28830 [Sodalis endosymbiont of Spalangia cameroni]|uniref:hypothetical protein n=1 Tax=Sodalis praecaptivus TaxID=1239307 RepID=UPI0031F730EE